jgi:hypothetical protein
MRNVGFKLWSAMIALSREVERWVAARVSLE